MSTESCVGKYFQNLGLYNLCHSRRARVLDALRSSRMSPRSWVWGWGATHRHSSLISVSCWADLISTPAECCPQRTGHKQHSRNWLVSLLSLAADDTGCCRDSPQCLLEIIPEPGTTTSWLVTSDSVCRLCPPRVDWKALKAWLGSSSASPSVSSPSSMEVSIILLGRDWHPFLAKMGGTGSRRQPFTYMSGAEGRERKHQLLRHLKNPQRQKCQETCGQSEIK